MVVVAALLDPAWKVEIEAEAVSPQPTRVPVYEASPRTAAATMLTPRMSPTRPDSMRFIT